MKTLIIDNYDSFTFNLYQMVGAISQTPPLVIPNDKLTWSDFVRLAPDNVILSPGPGRPENERDFGICRQIILDSTVPILGICLGMQGIGYAFGGTIVAAPEPVHGRLSSIRHDQTEIFKTIPQDFQAVRYHSLMLQSPIPDCLRVTAQTPDGVIMGLAHRERPIWGVQFHPESICTEHGERLLRNFCDLTSPRAADAREEKIDQSRTITAAPRSFPSTIANVRRLDLYPSSEDAFCGLFSDARPAFWLDSSDDGAHGSRFSFMGAGTPVACDGSPFDVIDAEVRRRRVTSSEIPFDFTGGLVGYFGYELKSECGSEAAHQSPYPNAALMFVDRFLAIDHQDRCVYIVCSEPEATPWMETMERRIKALSKSPELKNTGELATLQIEQSREEYVASIQECLRYIREGESYEICLTNKLKGETRVGPLDYYRVLRKINPAPYSAFLQFSDIAIACSSPERFLKIDSNGVAESRPIKGTIRRNPSPQADAEERSVLQNGIKTRSENLMIVDLLRNDLGRICEVGSVRVPRMMEIESYANLHQLVSTVQGKLRDEVSFGECLRSVFPGGSMTGAPKLRTMEILDRLERSARGIYSGALGFISLNGTCDLNIVIRTAVFAGGRVSIGFGGAIVTLSDPNAEFDEGMLKARALIDAFRPLVGSISVAGQD